MPDVLTSKLKKIVNSVKWVFFKYVFIFILIKMLIKKGKNVKLMLTVMTIKIITRDSLNIKKRNNISN